MTDTNKKELYKGYIQEALLNLSQQDLLKIRMAEIKDTVKNSGFDTKEFALDVKTAQDRDKTEAQLEALQVSLASIDSLKL